MRNRLVVAVLASLLAFPAPAALAAVDAATAESLLRDSGLWEALGEVASNLKSDLAHGIAEQPKKPARADVERFERLIDASFGSARLQAAARTVVEKEMSEAHVAELNVWFASPDGKAITKVEAAAPNDRKGHEKLKREGAALLEQMPSARRDLLEDILIASRTTEFLATVAIRSTVAVAGILRRAYPEAAVPNEYELRAQLESARSRIERNVAAGFLQMDAAVYRKIPDAKLQDYEKLLTSDAGRHLTDVFGKAVEQVLVDATTSLWKDLLPADKPAGI